ncbi:MAG: oligosaccharide flippase family protein [Candidatus Aenigmatarchaeota archaeon]
MKIPFSKSILGEIKKERELVNNTILMFLASFFQAISIFIVNLLLARFFTPTEFGEFRTIFYFVSFIPMLIDFGLSVTLSKYTPQFRVKEREKLNKLVRWSLKLRLTSFFVLLILLTIFAKQLSISLLHDPSRTYLIFLGFPLIISIFFNIFQSMTTGFENFKVFFFSRVVTSISFFAFVLPFAYFFGLPYCLVGFALAYILGNLYCLRFVAREGVFRKVDVNLDVKKIFFKFSIPIHVLSIPSYLGNVIVPILSLFFPLELIGQYSFSFLFYYGGLIIPSSFASVLLPKISKLKVMNDENKIREILLKVFFAYSIIILIIITLILLFGEILISTIAPNYLPGLLFFKVLASFGLFSGYISIYNSYLIAKEKIGMVALLILLQHVLLFGISFLLLKGV